MKSKAGMFTGTTGRVFLLICAMYFIEYIDRVNLSIAAPLLKSEMHLSNTQLGIALSAFGYCYAIFQVLNGYLGDRIGPRKMLAFSIPPGYGRKKPVVKPKLGPWLGIIDQILEDDKTQPKKQRHTAKRIWDRLKAEHAFTGVAEHGELFGGDQLLEAEQLLLIASLDGIDNSGVTVDRDFMVARIIDG